MIDAATAGVLTFTFHYGRIQSCVDAGAVVVYKYLHSIMVGFNQGFKPVRTLVSGIYIPLWSDSIQSAAAMATMTKKFTFHYGRIQSLGDAIGDKIAFVFTFHYGRIQSRRHRFD